MFLTSLLLFLLFRSLVWCDKHICYFNGIRRTTVDTKQWNEVWKKKGKNIIISSFSRFFSPVTSFELHTLLSSENFIWFKSFTSPVTISQRKCCYCRWIFFSSLSWWNETFPNNFYLLKYAMRIMQFGPIWKIPFASRPFLHFFFHGVFVIFITFLGKFLFRFLVVHYGCIIYFAVYYCSWLRNCDE